MDNIYIYIYFEKIHHLYLVCKQHTLLAIIYKKIFIYWLGLRKKIWLRACLFSLVI